MKWSRRSPVPAPVWFEEESLRFSRAVREASAGQVTVAIGLLADVRSDDLRDWFVEHGQQSGMFRARRVSAPPPIPAPVALDVVRNPTRIERSVLERDGYRCRYCNLKVIPKAILLALERAIGREHFRSTGTNLQRHGAVLAFRANVDHVLPWKLGGPHHCSQSGDGLLGVQLWQVLSPLLANIALSVLDEHFAQEWAELGPEWTRRKRCRAGKPAMRLIRYADDFVVLVAGTRYDAEALRVDVGRVLAPIGLRLSEPKTRVCHMDEGFDFLGFHIQRRPQPGSNKWHVYTYPSKKALAAIKDKVRLLTRRRAHLTLADLLRRINPVLRGWCNYFRHGVSKRTFGYLDHFTFWRVVGWLRKRHLGLNWGTLRRRFLHNWEIEDQGVQMFRPRSVAVSRYRFRGTKIPTPWTSEVQKELSPTI